MVSAAVCGLLRWIEITQSIKNSLRRIITVGSFYDA